MNNETEKQNFLKSLKSFAASLPCKISKNGEWTVRGFIDIFRNIYAISADTKLISKVIELHLFPFFIDFAQNTGFSIELAAYQNYYPDLTFVSKANPNLKFAVDLKTTYRLENYPGFCNGFTLGSHGTYFSDRTSTKNIQHPYKEYSGHFCLGIIYSRNPNINKEDFQKYTVNEIEIIPAVIKDFTFFAEEKWKIASDKSGSGNTANIGSIQNIMDILAGNGVFSKAGEEYFDDYWINFGKIEILDANKKLKKISSFEEYLKYRQLPDSLINPKTPRYKGKS